MSEAEGVIKYSLNHKNSPINPQFSLSEINAWRHILFKLDLIGQDIHRYDGYGFGNISQKISTKNDNQTQFIISGTQTGGLPILTQSQYCTIIKANPKENSIQSEGETQPSSEALTHASVYQNNKAIQAVIHVHSPEIWRNTERLQLPCTAADIVYGSVEMALEVEKLIVQFQLNNTGIFSMLGHEDGVVAFSDSMGKAALLIIKSLAKTRI